MSLKPLEQNGIDIEWVPWKLPHNANPPEKPEGYKEGAKVFLNNLLERNHLKLNPMTRKRDTFLAHIGGKFAKEKDQFEKYHVRIFQAVWVKDEDIDNIQVLTRIAQEIGFDVGAFKQALLDKGYQNRVEADFKQAEENQIWTIPAYVGEEGEIQVHHFNDIPNEEQLKNII